MAEGGEQTTRVSSDEEGNKEGPMPNLFKLENMCTVCMVRLPFLVEITWVLLDGPDGH